MKLVINRAYGGFCLSENQVKLLDADSEFTKIDRTNPILIHSVELGDTGGQYGALSIVEIPDNAFYEIKEYDGMEHVIWSETKIHTTF